MTEPVGDGYDILDDISVGFGLRQLINEVLIDLQAVHVQLALPGEGGIAYAKIIDGYLYALALEPGDDFIDVLIVL